MRLNSKFDILRGWPREGAIDETFPVHVTAGTPDALPLGTIVTMQSDGSMAVASTPDRTAANALPVWVVIEGNDDFSGTFLQKVVCLRGNAQLKFDPSNINAGAYTYGSPVSFTSGKLKLATTKDQIIGEALGPVAADGTLTVEYSGGSTAML